MTRCDECGQRIPERFSGAGRQHRFAVAPSSGESAVNADPDTALVRLVRVLAWQAATDTFQRNLRRARITRHVPTTL